MSMQPKKSVSAWLARSRTRARLHAGLLLVGAGLFLGLAISQDIFADLFRSTDKNLHYLTGQIIAAGLFYLTYLGIISRVLLAGRRGSSLTGVLLWIPTILAGGLLGGIVVVAGVSLGKEALDWGGPGRVEWLDVTASLQGALTILPPAAVIMALTPIFIPLDILMQLPRLMLSDARTGIKTLDIYVRQRKAHAKISRPVEVLLLEDDIYCASTTLSFFRQIGLKCLHLSTVREADSYLRSHLNELRVLVLDIFVRVDREGENQTGAAWLARLSRDFPRGRRAFLVVVISGHTEILGPDMDKADLVLAKPWPTVRLADFLNQHQLIPSGNTAS